MHFNASKVNLLLSFFFDLGFTALSRIFHLYFIKGGQKTENQGGKKHLTFRKQNLAFPHVTKMRLELELQQRET